MGRGVRPPGSRSEIAPKCRPLLILPLSWEGPPTAPIPPVFALRTPHFWICKTCKNLLLIICRGPATQIPPPYGRGVNNHLSRSSYGEDPPMGGGVPPIG